MNKFLKEAISDFLFEYETPRQVLVKNKRVGIVCRLIQLAVLAYIIGWVFIYERGYQSTDTAISSVFTKMKGITYTNESGLRIWDVVDYVFPQHGGDSFVVMTNYIMTSGQHLGRCLELPGLATCVSDDDCVEGKHKRTGNGKMTGKCINSSCEVFAWCPIEDDRTIPSPPLLLEAENFTLFIKNSITFPEFKVVRSNLEKNVDLGNCLYHKTSDPLCPIFRLGDIIEMSNFKFIDVAKSGAAIGILIDWTCNLDLPVDECKPKYYFHGLYGHGDKSNSSLGYNFRHAKYYVEDKIEKRTITKVFGIRFDIIVQGLARQFDIIPTLTTIGSGVGIFGVATVVCDMVLLYILPKRDFYKNMKFKYTAEQGEDKGLTQSKSENENN
ncbi:P2X purinoceptor 1 isoform X1 [Amia ocellicauda]|uniref:P2X purinoceptor 1 isoform X1 n=1 Tax=Amia ocellicauda TaxID=2972642 RepID=UPI0034639659